MPSPPSLIPRLFAFDFDGTLINTKPLYIAACIEYAQENNLGKCNLAGFVKAYGVPNAEDIDLGITCSAAEKANHLKNIYIKTDKLIEDEGRIPPLFSGVRETVAQLYDAGCIVSIVTSRPLSPVLAILRQHEIEKYFSIIRSHDDVAGRNIKSKPHPDKLLSVMQDSKTEKTDTLVIGDTWLDMEMALRAGVKAVAVSWGFGTSESFAPYEVPVLQENLEELFSVKCVMANV